MKKDYDLSKMKLKKKGAVAPKSTKVQKTIRLDVDIFEWLQDEGDGQGIGYQTFLNQFLRDSMVRSHQQENLQEIFKTLKTHDVKIKRIEKKIKEVS